MWPDGESGLYYAPHRYYSPFQARWTTRDPLGMVDGPNVYAYVRGNPVVYTDPEGTAVLIFALPLLAITALIALHGAATFECVKAHLSHRASQINQANWRNSDGWFHCMGMCEAVKNCGRGAEAIARRMGIARELNQREAINDQIDDLTANEWGLNCPGDQSCLERCEDYRPNRFPMPHTNPPYAIFNPDRWPPLGGNY